MVRADWDARAAFALVWGMLNFFWLALLRRPLVSAALSLLLIMALIVLSQFKHDVLMMTATFVDLMLIDIGTFWFGMTVVSGLASKAGVAALLLCVVAALWRIDPFRANRSIACAGGAACAVALAALSFASPLDREDEFLPHQYVSKFARSSATAVCRPRHAGYSRRIPRHLLGCARACRPLRHAAAICPHIVMVLDNSSFDATMMPRRHCAGRATGSVSVRRTESCARCVVEGAGGPTWYTEYNVLTGPLGTLLRAFCQSVTGLPPAT